jgi:hypothetical protein
VVIDSLRDGGSNAPPAVAIEPKTTSTPGPIARTATALGVLGRTNTTTAVRYAPGARTSIFGTLPRGSEVTIDGRSSDSGWLRIVFPPNSEEHGWVDARYVDVTTGEVTTLVVATAEPPVFVDQPTRPPVTEEPLETEAPADGTATAEATPTPGGLPDLVVGTSPIVTGGVLVVTVVNQGPGDMTGDLVVAVFNAEGTALIGGATIPAFSLATGRSIDVNTGFPVTQNQSLLLVVDPNGEIEETDNTNNRITVAVSVGTPPPPPEVTVEGVPAPDVTAAVVGTPLPTLGNDRR